MNFTPMSRHDGLADAEPQAGAASCRKLRPGPVSPKESLEDVRQIFGSNPSPESLTTLFLACNNPDECANSLGNLRCPKSEELLDQELERQPVPLGF